MYVPGEWWHAVVNLTDTVALTENNVTSGNFEETWRSIRLERFILNYLNINFIIF